MDEIKVGILVNTHGLRGEVKIKPTTDFADIRFSKGKTVYVQYQNQSIPVEIQYAKWVKQLLIVKFKNFDNINLVECWKGSSITVLKEDLHELEDDEAYFFELMNCKVYDINNEYLGNVVEVVETNANACLRVKNDEREFLVPYVNAFIKSFDKENKKIVIELMEGLL